MHRCSVVGKTCVKAKGCVFVCFTQEILAVKQVFANETNKQFQTSDVNFKSFAREFLAGEFGLGKDVPEI